MRAVMVLWSPVLVGLFFIGSLVATVDDTTWHQSHRTDCVIREHRVNRTWWEAGEGYTTTDLYCLEGVDVAHQ